LIGLIKKTHRKKVKKKSTKKRVGKTPRRELPFSHLHSHDEYSLKDGCGTVENYIQKASDMNMEAFTITNHGGNGQWIRQYFGMQEINKKRLAEGKAPMKNVFGEEYYFMYDRDKKLERIREINSILEKNKKAKDGATDSQKLSDERKSIQQDSFHLVVLAKNQIGFTNALFCHNDAMMNGFYYRPNVSFEELKNNSEGLIILSACLGGAISKPIMDKNIKLAESRAKEFKRLWGNDFYIEIQLHDFKGQREVNIELIRISKKFSIPLVITNDSHYIDEEDAEAQGTLTLSISKKTWEDYRKGVQGAWVFDSKQLWYKSESEIYAEYKKRHSDYLSESDYKEAILNTGRIVKKIGTDINFRETENHIPNYCSPEKGMGILKSKIRKGFIDRGLVGKADYIERIKYEIDTIDYLKNEHYFLIVADVVDYVIKKYGKEALGKGRGSGASSLVNYVLRITDIDPLFWELPFERFLSKGRKDMPDIDSDFLPEIRDDIKRYIIEKYGQDHTASISTYGTYQMKACIDDVFRAFNFSIAQAKSLKASLTEDVDDMDSWEEILETNPKLAELKENHPKVFHVIKVLKGQIRHISTHAAGVLITKNPIMRDISISRVGDKIVSSWVEGQSRSELGRIGRVKLDILGLETLEELRYGNDLIEKRHGKRIDWDEVDLYTDKMSVKCANEGRTKWIFQFINQGMIQLLKNAKIKTVRDWIAISALGRPAPRRSGMADQFCRRSTGKEEFKLHPLIEKVCGETYGVITYQEHVMRLCVILADFTMEEADGVRKVLTKIKAETEHLYGAKRDEYKKKFIKNATKKIGEKEAKKIWELMLQFTKYGFNKAHATCYGLTSAECLYMFTHYQIEFITSVLNSQSKKFKEGEESKLVYYLKEAKMLGYKVMFPQVNKSTWQMNISGNDEIIYGLSFVKGIGENSGRAIEQIKVKKLNDFFSESTFNRNITKRVVEPLIKIGYFDSIFENRKVLWETYLEWNEKRKSSFESILKTHEENDFTETEKAKFEMEYLGIYINSHPLQKYEDLKEEYELITIDEAGEYSKANLLCMISKVKEYTCKSGLMAFLEVEDENSKMDLTIFPETYKKYSEVIKAGKCLAFKITSSPKGFSVDGYAKGEQVMEMDSLLPKVQKSRIKKKKTRRK
jgi:DNA polymerase-3 subunit alpha